jgi:membrane protease YdiL (CAAX protease family)
MQTTSSPISSEPFPRSRSDTALAVWLGLSILLTAFAFVGARQGGDDGGAEALFRWEFAIGSALVYGVIVGIAWLAARPFGDARVALGLRRFERRWIWITLGLTFLALVVSTALEPIFRAGEKQGLAPERWDGERAWAFAVNAVVVVVLVPFAEELFYRGLGVRALAFLGKWVAIVGTAVAFALAHGLLAGIPALGFFALALGWVRWRTASVWPGVLSHGLYNGVGIAVAAYLARNPDKAPSALAFLL